MSYWNSLTRGIGLIGYWTHDKTSAAGIKWVGHKRKRCTDHAPRASLCAGWLDCSGCWWAGKEKP